MEEDRANVIEQLVKDSVQAKKDLARLNEELTLIKSGGGITINRSGADSPNDRPRTDSPNDRSRTDSPNDRSRSPGVRTQKGSMSPQNACQLQELADENRALKRIIAAQLGMVTDDGDENAAVELDNADMLSIAVQTAAHQQGMGKTVEDD